jgi:hypothetical protein
MADSLFSVEGRLALVTGSSRGIGKALAAGLLTAGADVVLNGRDVDQLERTRAELTGLGGEVQVRSEFWVGPLVYRVTNESIGAQTNLDASSSAVIVYNADGSSKWYLHGPLGLATAAGKGNLPRGLWQVDGPAYTLEISAAGYQTLTGGHDGEHLSAPYLTKTVELGRVLTQRMTLLVYWGGRRDGMASASGPSLTAPRSTEVWYCSSDTRTPSIKAPSVGRPSDRCGSH